MFTDQDQRQRHKCLFAILFCLLPVAFSATAWGAAYQEAYVPPELMHKQALNYQIQLSDVCPINLLSLRELTVLPGFDEALALKVIRLRPFKDAEDLYRRLPPDEKIRLEQLMQTEHPALIFNEQPITP